jgi:hypothetical protein
MWLLTLPGPLWASDQRFCHAIVKKGLRPAQSRRNLLLTILRLSSIRRPCSGTMLMSQTDYEAALAEFLAKKAVTRCPTAAAVPTHGDIGPADRAALRDYVVAQEAARQAKYQERFSG